MAIVSGNIAPSQRLDRALSAVCAGMSDGGAEIGMKKAAIAASG
ncbi:hypothetical protein OCJ37_17535 [Xanthomonas sp. AM6]|nr:hypothetical protein [Xanthomonas sp. AM6]UYB51749.1 hypothetical protein OCJ37_17535 [Xanthomonas sp. AM6]